MRTEFVSKPEIYCRKWYCQLVSLGHTQLYCSRAPEPRLRLPPLGEQSSPECLLVRPSPLSAGNFECTFEREGVPQEMRSGREGLSERCGVCPLRTSAPHARWNCDTAGMTRTRGAMQASPPHRHRVNSDPRPVRKAKGGETRQGSVRTDIRPARPSIARAADSCLCGTTTRSMIHYLQPNLYVPQESCASDSARREFVERVAPGSADCPPPSLFMGQKVFV